jgi:hypothetical protein
MTLTDADIEAIFRAANIEFDRHYSPPLSAEDVAVVRRVVEFRYLVFAAMILANNGWHDPVESARKLRRAARRFMSSKGAKR